jgi:hypothetical protein
MNVLLHLVTAFRNPEHMSSCDTHRDKDYLAWCESMTATPEVHTARQQALEAALAQCSWRRSELPEISVAHSVTGHPPKYVKQDADNYQLESCLGAEGWVYHRMGPMVTYGGYDWTTYSYTVPNTDSSSPWNGTVFLEGYWLGSVSRAGSLLGYPPIHQHHTLLNVPRPDPPAYHAAFIHGDTECTPADGGVGCQIRIFPPGRAMNYRFPIRVGGEINDVRVNSSTPLEHFHLVAMKLHEGASPPRPITMAGYAGFGLRPFGPGVPEGASSGGGTLKFDGQALV